MEESFQKAIVENYEDWTPWLVYADWLDEHGQGDLAYAYRWCHRKGKKPYYRPELKKFKWGWFTEFFDRDLEDINRYYSKEAALRRQSPQSLLPQDLMLLIGDGTYEDEDGTRFALRIFYPTLDKVMGAVSQGLTRARNLVE